MALPFDAPPAALSVPLRRGHILQAKANSPKRAAMTKLFRSTLLAASLLTPGAALAAGLSVPMDEVRMLSFARPAATVYVGNPTIADVNVIDSKRVFVLGKTFGQTNIIALDSEGKQIANARVTVFGRSGSVVTLNKGTQQTTFACTGQRCENAPTPGDSKDNYDTAMGQIEKHLGMGSKSASNE